MINITHNAKEYAILDIDKLIQNGSIVPVLEYPLLPGDVYKHPKRSIADFLLVRSVWAEKIDDLAYSLLGYDGGLEPYSNDFFHSLHTKDEIRDYLIEKGMVFSHNISGGVRELIDQGQIKY